MQLDYNFIKEIMIAMESSEAHEIRCQELMQKTSVMDISNKINDLAVDKFIGHIKILGDNNLIESSKSNYGFLRANKGYVIDNATYRITAQGYEFLDVLKNDTAFNKIKDFALSNALDIGKQIIVKLATGGK